MEVSSQIGSGKTLRIPVPIDKLIRARKQPTEKGQVMQDYKQYGTTEQGAVKDMSPVEMSASIIVLLQMVAELKDTITELKEDQQDAMKEFNEELCDKIDNELDDKVDDKVQNRVSDAIDDINWDAHIVRTLCTTSTLEEIMTNGDFGVMVEKLARQVAEEVLQTSVMSVNTQPIVLAYDKTTSQWGKIS